MLDTHSSTLILDTLISGVCTEYTLFHLVFEVLRETSKRLVDMAHKKYQLGLRKTLWRVSAEIGGGIRRG